MIYFLTTRQDPFRPYLKSWGKELAGRIRVTSYDRIVEQATVRGGTYVFSDIERLHPTQAEKAAHLSTILKSSREDVRILNHPTRSMRRFELLSSLYKIGFNDFNVHRLIRQKPDIRYPVFVRRENDHEANLTPLLYTEKELIDAEQELCDCGLSRDDKVIIEYCDTSCSAGLFRKYGAYIIGDAIIPEHILFASSWMVKTNTKIHNIDQSMLYEIASYVETNPHEEQLREVFRIAGIDFGRIDYSMLDGKLQVWEINTLPTLLNFNFGEKPPYWQQKQTTAQRLNLAFRAIDTPAKRRRQIEIFPNKTGWRLSVYRTIARLPTSWQPAAMKFIRVIWKVLTSVYNITK